MGFHRLYSFFVPVRRIPDSRPQMSRGGGSMPLHQVPLLIVFTGQFISSYLQERSGYGDVECGFSLPLTLKFVLTVSKVEVRL